MQTGMIDNTAATNTASTTKKLPSNTMDKNAFLQLLVAQLQNQDPTQSQDPNAMVQQMTSFSSLEQMQNTNTLLSGIQNQNAGLFQAQTSSLIGKNVRVASTSFDLKGGAATVGINLAAAADVTLTITDAAGRVVRTLQAGPQKAGTTSLAWDGKDDAGHALSDGSYTVAIAAKGADGKDVTSATSAYLTVKAVTFVNGAVMINAGGKTFSLSDVNEISA